MSGSDTESADLSADTDVKRACKQISIYDKRTVCLDDLVTPNNKKFTSRYKEGTFLREHDQRTCVSFAKHLWSSFFI